MRSAAPLRFLAAVVLGWVGLRAALLAPFWGPDKAPAAPRPAGAAGEAAAPARVAETLPLTAPPNRRQSRDAHDAVSIVPTRIAIAPPASAAPPPRPASSIAAIVRSPLGMAAVPPLAPPPPPNRRWSVSAWLLARGGGDGRSLAGGGSLGGSQAGMRLLYRINRSLALSGRLYLPVRRPEDAELASGLDWQPLRTAPIHLVAERRQALGRDGRSAFALTVYGGLSQSLPGRLRLDAYGQAGLVGLRTRDAFADGAIRLSRSFGRLDLGGGAWGAAQPGAARFDAGPTLALRLPALRARLEADWRFRLAGGAAPGSGPALVLAADF